MGRLILAQHQEDWLPHDAVLGPLLKGNLANERRLDPLNQCNGLGLILERTGRLYQGIQFGPDERQSWDETAAAMSSP